MGSIDFAFRLMPGAVAEQEWLYLINESYIGERCIVPLLTELLEAPVAGVGFRRMITRQIQEEREHVARYADLLRQPPADGSGYDREFATYVQALPNTTSKVYALQVLLEGVSLGALQYRIHALASSPSAEFDRRVHQDELRHTRFAHAFVRLLIGADGVLPRENFRRMAREVNAIFARHFNGAHLASWMRRTFGVQLSAESIDTSPGMRKFHFKSLNAVLASKAEFLQHYEAAVSCAV